MPEPSDKTKKKIANTLSDFFQSEEGKLNKQKALEKRSETMRKEREKLQNSITEKECKRCKKTKPVDEFHKKYNAKDGRQSNCKHCINVIKRQKRKEKAKFNL